MCLNVKQYFTMQKFFVIKLVGSIFLCVTLQNMETVLPIIVKLGTYIYSFLETLTFVSSLMDLYQT